MQNAPDDPQSRASAHSVTPPSEVALAMFAARLGIDLEDSDLSQWHATLMGAMPAYDAVARLTEEHVRARSHVPRTVSAAQVDSGDPWGAWRLRTSIHGAPTGSLQGRRIVVKDSIGISGVPLTNGSDALTGYMPETDAIVVDRVLAAGAEIAGTSVCESFCLSGVSHTASTGPVRNPFDLNHSAGGSTSGAAVLVSTGQVDMAIGGDQGGSIRLPASACGIMGMKPTFGLVPYGGAIPVEPTLDHLGPMARTAEDLALLLASIAGPAADGTDAWLEDEYTSALTEEVEGLRIGLLREGFGHYQSEAVVDETVRTAIAAYAELGAAVRDVSVPWHLDAGAVHNVVLTEGGATLLWRDKGLPPGHLGPYMHGLGSALGAAFQGHGLLPDGLIAMALTGLWCREDGHGEWYAKARRLVPIIRSAYDELFEDLDLLALPTSVSLPIRLPSKSVGRFEKLSLPKVGINTAPFNLTGHPALSVPCGQIGQLPLGMMLVAPHGGERTLFRAASAFERQIYSCPAPPAQDY